MNKRLVIIGFLVCSLVAVSSAVPRVLASDTGATPYSDREVNGRVFARPEKRSGAEVPVVIATQEQRLPKMSAGTMQVNDQIAQEVAFWTQMLEKALLNCGSKNEIRYALNWTKKWLKLLRQTGDSRYSHTIAKAEALIMAGGALLEDDAVVEVTPGNSPSGTPVPVPTPVPASDPEPASKPATEQPEKAREAANNVEYGLNRLEQGSESGKSALKLLESLYWTEARLRQLQTFTDPQSVEDVSRARARLIFIREGIARELSRTIDEGLKQAEKRLASSTEVNKNSVTIAGIESRLAELKKLSDAVTAAEIQALEKRLQAVKANTVRQLSALRNLGGVPLSERGEQQLKKVAAYAQAHQRGYSGGDCFNFVWGYLTASGYGKLNSWGDLPNMQSGEARHFAEYLNSGQAHLDEAGLQRLDTTLTPPITNPHDERIPNGAVIVVAAGSYGTAHATAGDIVIKAGSGHFINDGPNMDYGSKGTWYGKLLGVYIPK